MGFRTSGSADFVDKRKLQQQEEEDRKKMEQASAEKEGGDIGGILGMLALGLGAAAAIAFTGGVAAPAAIGAIAGAATTGGAIGQAVGKQVGKSSYDDKSSEPAQAPKPIDMEGAMKRKLGDQFDLGGQLKDVKIPPSDQTQLLTQSVKALSQLPDDVQNEYSQLLLKGVVKSYSNDIFNSRRKA